MGNPAGRPPTQDFTDAKVLKKVHDLAAQCVAEKNIATILGYSAEEFSRKKKTHPQLAQAIKAGRAEGEAVATEALLKEVRGRNMTAIIWYLKSQHGWRDNAFGSNDDGASGDTGSVGRRVLDSVRRIRDGRSGKRSEEPTD